MGQEIILIAASETEAFQALAGLLARLGYIVAGHASGGEAALQMAAERKPDLVFVEIGLEGQVTAIEAAQRIQSSFDIPVIFTGGSADASARDAAQIALAYGYLPDPLQAGVLEVSLRTALHKHGLVRRLRESEQRHALAVRAAGDGLWDWNLRTNTIYYSRRWKEMLGFEESEIGTDLSEWLKRVHPDDRKQLQANFVSHLQGSAPHFESEYRIQHANGTYVWARSLGMAMRDSRGTAYRIAGSQSDITARKLAEERLAHDALHDPLTGLPNRVLFLDRLQNRLERTRRNPEDLFAVMFIDLDRFKVVNDSLGHAFGDQLLVTVAHRLKQCLRPEDTVSRLSGDEFAVLLDVVSDLNTVRRIADRIRGQLVTTTLLGVVERSPTASIGIAMFTASYTSADELLRDADLAMYHAKAAGGNQFQLFDETMHTSAVELIRLEGELKRAVDRNEWVVHFQPIISVSTGKPVGAEALVRWMHPQRGLLAPQEFIHVAEDTGLIIPLGEYVLRTACAQARAWREAGQPDFWVSVNISARQFKDRDLVQKITRILSSTGLASDGLRLEITESVAVQDQEYTIKILTELEGMGVHTSLDDFGTGYSSISYLKQFPLKVLKIDRSFVHDIQLNEKNEALIKAIIGMARSIGLEVVAEGVEQEDQLSFLRSQLCDHVQGYLIGRPMLGPDLQVE